MGLAEDVANLPGGRTLPALIKLSALINKVNGSPETIRTVATHWRETAEKTNENIRDLNTAVKNIDNVWQGGSADDFNTYMQKYGKAGDALHDMLSNFATSLDTAAQTLETSKSNVNAIGTNFLNQRNTYLANNPKADQKVLDKNIADMASSAASDADSHVDAADDAVTATLKSIKTFMDEKPAFFSRIEAPGDDKFFPGSAPAFDWRRTPNPDPGRTTLAVADSGGNTPGGNGSGGPGGGSAAQGSGGASPVPYVVVGSGTGADIVAAAQANLGKPYVWGADGPSAFDCSGLVFNALNTAGIEIGDTTAAGYQASGQPITLPPQAGDIVFFGNPPEHCGIYVGDGKMINAPRPGEVVRFDDIAGGAQPITYRRFT